MAEEAVRLGFPDANSPVINFCARCHIFIRGRKANRSLKITLRNNRGYYRGALFPRCPAVASVGLAIRKNIASIKHSCFLLAMHCHFQDGNICSVMLPHSLPWPLQILSFWKQRLLSRSLSTPPSSPSLSLLFLLLSATQSFLTSSFSLFSSLLPHRQSTDKIACSSCSTAICVFFYSRHAPQTAWGITFHSRQRRTIQPG